MVINCMGKGKEGSQTYNMYIEIYTQLEGGEQTKQKQKPLAQILFMSLSNWVAEKNTSEIRISLGLTYTLMAN